MQSTTILPVVMSRTIPLRVGLALAALTAPLHHVTAGADEGAFQRWAIVADRATEQAGMVELLTAALTRLEGVTLVERQQIAAILSEWELTAALTAEGSDKRLELGRVLKADAILTLSMIDDETVRRVPDREPARRHIQVVVSESRFGARVRLDYLVYDPQQREAIVTELCRMVSQLREQFPQGVTQMIAVPPFITSNLLRDYDHLQAGYARLLEAAWMDRHGLAVLETEEARAIRRELELDGQSRVRQAAVPWFVEGQFEVSPANADAGPTVRLTIRVSDGQAVRWETQRDGMPLAEVPDFLVHTVADQVAGLPNGVPLPDRRRLFTWLAARAEAFSSLANYQHAAELREAALLLEPEDLEQRLGVIGDLYRWRQPADREQYEHQRQRHGENRAAEFLRTAAEAEARQRRIKLALACGHLEYLLRRRALNLSEAGLIASQLLLQLDYYSRHYHGGAAEVQAEARAWFWRIYGRFPQLDPELAQGMVRPPVATSMRGGFAHRVPQSALSQQASFLNRAASLLLAEANRSRTPNWERLADDYYRLLTEVADPDLLLPLPASPPGDDAQKARFALRLIGSGQPANVFRGRLELLAMEIEGRRERRPWRELRREWEDLSARWETCSDDDPNYRTVSGAMAIGRRLSALDAELRRLAAVAPPEKQWPPPRNPLETEPFARRVVFEPVSDMQPEWSMLAKCHETLDVAWGVRHVDVLPAPGIVQTIFRIPWDWSRSSTEQDAIYWVVWDGAAFWIACCRSGIHVVSPSGQRLGRVDREHGLPPHQPGNLGSMDIRLQPGPIALHPLGEGSCFAMGQTPGDFRLWFARIDRIPGAADLATYAVNVFHTAVKEPSVPGEGRDDDSSERFRPGWITEYRVPASGRRMLLVGREPQPGADPRHGRSPLAIDLETLDVSILPVPLPSPSSSFALCQGAGGFLVAASWWHIELFEATGEHGENWQQRSLMETDRRGFGPRPEALLPLDDQFVLPGNRWLILDLQRENVERLATPFMPQQHPFSRYADSAHYGLVGWDVGGPLVRFSIGPVPGANDAADVHYPFLPAEHRARHHRAVEAIRRLGGDVKIRWGHRRRLGPRMTGRVSTFNPAAFPKRWRTIVYLSDEWRGGDEGLLLLDGLYNLAELYLVRAPVSDAGMRMLRGLRSLESLYLVETQVTDAGLEPLAAAEQLDYLRLEGATGDEFTHHGLAHLTGLPKLRKLTLYGAGFSEQAVAPLETFAALEELTVLDTQLSTAALQSLAASRQAAGGERKPDPATGTPSPSTDRPRPFVFWKNPPPVLVD
jgi:hypothetical protein